MTRLLTADYLRRHPRRTEQVSADAIPEAPEQARSTAGFSAPGFLLPAAAPLCTPIGERSTLLLPL
jgi:hypothetical protein